MSLTAERWSEVMAQNTGVQLTLGPNTVGRYLLDPKRLGFMMARYKFAAKTLRDCGSIIDVGCGDGFGTLTFLEESKAGVHGVDLDPELIRHAKGLKKSACSARPGNTFDRLAFDVRDMLENPLPTGDARDGLCCLDVIEHIEPERASEFVRNLSWTLKDNGIAIIGTPSEYASQFASPQSQLGHINLYSPDRLRQELKAFFRHVFIWGMNDEIPHLGYDKLYHYILAVCIK